jgi:hypothetical protein
MRLQLCHAPGWASNTEKAHVFGQGTGILN